MQLKTNVKPCSGLPVADGVEPSSGERLGLGNEHTTRTKPGTNAAVSAGMLKGISPLGTRTWYRRTAEAMGHGTQMPLKMGLEKAPIRSGTRGPDTPVGRGCQEYPLEPQRRRRLDREGPFRDFRLGRDVCSSTRAQSAGRAAAGGRTVPFR